MTANDSPISSSFGDNALSAEALQDRLAPEQLELLAEYPGGVTISFATRKPEPEVLEMALLSSLPGRMTIEPISLSDAIGSRGEGGGATVVEREDHPLERGGRVGVGPAPRRR
jgi:hypothetical protein